MYVLRRLVKNKAVCSLLPQQVSGVDYARPLLLGDERSGRFFDGGGRSRGHRSGREEDLRKRLQVR